MTCSSCTPTNDERIWLKLGISWVLVGQTMVLGLAVSMTPPPYGTGAYIGVHGVLAASALGVFWLLGGRLIRAQWRAICARKITTEALFLLSISGAVGASVLGSLTGRSGVYYELVAIVLSLYALGERVQAHAQAAVLRQADALRSSLDRARFVGPDAVLTWVPLDTLVLGDTVLVQAGEVIPVDGVIVQGASLVQESAVNGELVPVPKGPKASVYAGSYAVDGALWIQVEALKGQRKIDALMASLEQARRAPSALQELGNRLVRFFVPVAVAVSLGTFVFWAGKAGEAGSAGWMPALLHAMAVLLVACPCAFGLATPLALWRGLIALAQKGIVARTGRLLDVLACVTHVVWDKTGTLSEVALVLEHTDLISHEAVLPVLLFSLQDGQTHPVAQAMCQAFKDAKALAPVSYVKLHPAKGIEGRLEFNGKSYHVFAGTLALMPCAFPDYPSAKQRIYVSINAQAAASLTFSERLRPEALQTLEQLKAQGISLRILSGDPHPAWSHLAGVPIEFGYTPEEKKAVIQKLIDHDHATVLFIGDGLNDLSAMSASCASLAMGSSSALTQATASGVLLSGRLDALPETIALAKRCYTLVRSNLRFSLVYNLLAMTLAALGHVHPVLAALLMLGSSTVVSVRSFRG